jgi:hypothetical protein
LRYYCNILAPNTNGSVRDKIQKQQTRLAELENASIKLLTAVESFARRIESQQPTEGMDIRVLNDEYNKVIGPVEELILGELCMIRSSLQDVLDTIRSEHRRGENFD